jgi:DNA polymerase-3 subunit alpha
MVRIERYVELASQLGYASLGISDINSMSGVFKFIRACENKNIKPIVGLAIEVQDIKVNFVALNYEGLLNLFELSSLKMTKPYNEELALEELMDLVGENIVTVIQNEVPTSLLRGRVYAGRTTKSFHNDAFEQFYKTNNIPELAFNEVRYFNIKDAFSFKVLESIRDNEQLEGFSENEVSPLNFESEAQAREGFIKQNRGEALDNLDKLVDLIDIKIPEKKLLLPHYIDEAGVRIKESDELLEKKCLKNLSEMFEPTDLPKYFERLEYELGVIKSMGFSDYFLITADVIDYCHKHQIITGAGRGSAAGSLVSFALHITTVDPIKYDLLFERFLNPMRVSMPDIDMDLPDIRRVEVLEYLQQKYGRDKMVGITTYNTLKAKQVLRDVTRVFQLSKSESDEWSKAIGKIRELDGHAATLKEMYETNDDLKRLANKNERNRNIIEVAINLENLPRNASTHAAGIIITDNPITNYVPVMNGTGKIFNAQVDMNDVESRGLLKMDFLGLKNLSILDEGIRSVKADKKIDIDINKIDMQDEKILDLFRTAQMNGIFQFESSGIRGVLKRVHPNTIDDIAAVNALYRPGPQENIPEFIERKNNGKEVIYLDPRLEPILKETYGIMVYQEQVMQSAQVIAGYTLGEADILRRAMSKKKTAEMHSAREDFIRRSGANGSKIFDYIERFAGYGFNKSHAFAYSFIAYQLAYLKVYYPLEFYKGLLNSSGSEKTREYINEAKRFGQVSPPDINHSFSGFSIANDSLVFGFGHIKGIRGDFAKLITEEREINGRYNDFDNFLLRLPEKWLKAEYIEPLIKVGAFDKFVKNRRQLVVDLDKYISSIKFGSLNFAPVAPTEIGDYNAQELLEIESGLLGVTLSAHPIEQFKQLSEQYQVIKINELELNKKAHVLVMIKKIKEIRTKKGEVMAFLDVEDDLGEFSLTLFPTTYRAIGEYLKMGDVILAYGKVENDKFTQGIQMIVDKIDLAKRIVNNGKLEKLWLNVPVDKEMEVRKILTATPGNLPTALYVKETNTREVWMNNRTAEFVENFRKILGDENVVIK